MVLSKIRPLFTCSFLLVATTSALAISLSSPIPLTDPVEGGAWTRSESVSSVWVGNRFLSVWIETRTGGEWYLMAGRFGTGGERVDGHGVELDQRAEIWWARVVIAAGRPHVVYQLSDEIVIARIEENFETTPVASFDASGQRMEASGTGNHILVSWTSGTSGPVRAVVADVSNRTLVGPVVVDHDGYSVSVAGDGGTFLVVYNQGWSGPGRVMAAFVGVDGIVGEPILIGENAGPSPTSVTFAGSGYVVAYGAPFRMRTVSPGGELGEVRSWNYPAPGGALWNQGMALVCGEDGCLIVVEMTPICRVSACPVLPVDMFAKRLDSGGNPLEEEWTLVPDDLTWVTESRIASAEDLICF